MPATLDEVTDALIENADFEEVNSLSKAKAFISAANRYFILQPASASDQGSSLSMGFAQVQTLLARAQSWVKASSSATAADSRVRFLSAGEGFRR